jgi:hypothetical protein
VGIGIQAAQALGDKNVYSAAVSGFTQTMPIWSTPARSWCPP